MADKSKNHISGGSSSKHHSLFAIHSNHSTLTDIKNLLTAESSLVSIHITYSAQEGEKNLVFLKVFQ